VVRAEERRRLIIELLEREGEVAVDALAQRFGVSQVTIRKDLHELEERGILHRTHGGAIPVHKSLFNPSFYEKLNFKRQEKQAIAWAALELIQEGDSIILDAGSTTLALARLLRHRFRRLYVITNSMPVALELSKSGFDVLLTGGQMRHHSLALIGPAAVDMLRHYHVDKAFLGATGVDDQGYSTPNPIEAQTKRALLQAASVAYVLADSSKLGQPTLARFAALEEVALLITDAAAPADFLSRLDARGLRYLLAPNVDAVEGKRASAGIAAQDDG